MKMVNRFHVVKLKTIETNVCFKRNEGEQNIEVTGPKQVKILPRQG